MKILEKLFSLLATNKQDYYDHHLTLEQHILFYFTTKLYFLSHNVYLVVCLVHVIPYRLSLRQPNVSVKMLAPEFLDSNANHEKLMGSL